MYEPKEFAEPDLSLHLTGALLKNRYRVVSLLGKSGFAFAYLAMDERSSGGKTVVKLAHPELAIREKFKECFDHEVSRLVGFELPHLVSILDLGDFRGMPFAVVEYASGGNLLSRFAAGEGGVQPAELVEWFPPIARTLDWLHERGFVHRDVKPENILFDHSGRAMLSDLAMAKVLQSMEARAGSVESIVGSPPYMAPEALRFAQPEPPYDQYSLGVVLYQALCGRLPHDWDTPLALLTRKVQEAPRHLQDFAPHLPDEAARAVMRALDRDPARRFDSCTELVAAFGEGLGTQRFISVMPKMPDRFELIAPPAAESAEAPIEAGSPVPRGEKPADAASGRQAASVLVLAGALVLLVLAATVGPVMRSPSPAAPRPAQAAPLTAQPQTAPALPAATAEANQPSAVAAPQPATAAAAPQLATAAAAPQLATAAAAPQPMATATHPPAMSAEAIPATQPSTAEQLPTPQPLASPGDARGWQALIEGPSLPAWQTSGQSGWSVHENILRLQGSSVLVTNAGWRNVAFTLKARPLEPGTIFGMVARAQGGGRAVRAEMKDGKGSLRSGDVSAPFELEWPVGEWHQLVLITSDETVLAYVDKKKAASIIETDTEGPGRIGVYCKAGSVEFRVVYVQSLD